LLLWALSLGLIILLESTSHLFSSYHRSKLKKRAFSGLLGILAWWWIGAFSLQFTDELTSLLLPNLADLSLFDVASFGAMGVLGVVISATIDLTLFLLVALLYYVRQVVLYLFVLLMPVLIALWVPGVGPFTLLSRFVKRLAGFYVPFLFMTVPVALLFTLSGLLGSSATLSLGGVGQWLVAISVPFVAVVVPFVLFWQAGALFFLADRVSQHSSRHRASERFDRAQAAGATARNATRNFQRGASGALAIRRDGQLLLDSSTSSAHSAGDRVARAGQSLGQSLSSGLDEGRTGSSDQASTDRVLRRRPSRLEEQRAPSTAEEPADESSTDRTNRDATDDDSTDRT